MGILLSTPMLNSLLAGLTTGTSCEAAILTRFESLPRAAFHMAAIDSILARLDRCSCSW